MEKHKKFYFVSNCHKKYVQIVQTLTHKRPSCDSRGNLCMVVVPYSYIYMAFAWSILYFDTSFLQRIFILTLLYSDKQTLLPQIQSFEKCFTFFFIKLLYIFPIGFYSDTLLQIVPLISVCLKNQLLNFSNYNCHYYYHYCFYDHYHVIDTIVIVAAVAAEYN